MKMKYFLMISFMLSVLLTADIPPPSGTTLAQSITLLYSNNINAEIDPCPV